MIKFFRQIRQQLLTENKFSKYFLYAIGEIILVVIGILIALSINNWNQHKLETKKEQLLLEQLHIEFLENKIQLENTIDKHETALRAVEYIISQFPIDIAIINLDTLMVNRKGWANTYTFNPSQGVIKSLVNSSSFDLISNSNLRALLVSWEDVLADYQEEELTAKETFGRLISPVLLKNIPMGNFNDNRFDKKYLASFEFENIYKLRQRNLEGIILNNEGELIKIRETINQIIELSKPNNQ